MQLQVATCFLVCALVACHSGTSEPADAGPGPDAADEVDAGRDAGAPAPLTWSPPENVSSSQTYSDQRINWGNSIAVSAAGTVHATWREVDDPQQSPVVARAVHRRRDGSGAWGTPQDVGPSEAGVGHPKIATADGHVYVVWHRYDPDPAGSDHIFAAVSNADGQPGSFTGPVTIVDDAPVVVSPAGELSTSPSIAAEGGRVHVVWSDDRLVSSCGTNVPEVHLSTSGDHGSTWSSPLQVSEPDCRSSWTPTVATAEGYVHVAWTDDRHNTDDCALGSASCHEEEYYRRLSDDGATLDTPEHRLTTDVGAPLESWAGNITVSGTTVHYAWMDVSGGDGFEIYYGRSTDRGAQWSLPSAPLTSHAPGCISARPTIAAEAEQVHLVYFELCGDTDATVWHRWSADGGITWSAPSDVTSGSAVFAIQPSVAVHAGQVHVLWTDQGELYYATAATP